MYLRELVSSLAIAVALLLLPCAASAQWPDGAGKDTTLQLCSGCHDPSVIQEHRQSRDEWIATIQKMVASGAQGTEDQLAAVLDYVTKNYGPARINVNRASAADLETTLGLTGKEAAAIVTYRTGKGPFKTPEDLKNVPGLDYKKIDSQKDRLDF